MDLKNVDPLFVARFFQNIKKPINRNNCWEWAAAKIGKGGYGIINHKLAHRLSWEIFKGPIKDGHYVCHHCDNPPCVNPKHLFLGTRHDNMQDCVKKGRMFLQKHPERSPKFKKTHCPSGHPYSGSNIMIDHRGYRRCRICTYISNKKTKARKAIKDSE